MASCGALCRVALRFGVGFELEVRTPWTSQIISHTTVILEDVILASRESLRITPFNPCNRADATGSLRDVQAKWVKFKILCEDANIWRTIRYHGESCTDTIDSMSTEKVCGCLVPSLTMVNSTPSRQETQHRGGKDIDACLSASGSCIKRRWVGISRLAVTSPSSLSEFLKLLSTLLADDDGSCPRIG